MRDDEKYILDLRAKEAAIGALHDSYSSIQKPGMWSFAGRVSRSGYWIGAISLSVLDLIAQYATGMMSSDSHATKSILIYIPTVIANMWLALAGTVKRWHDLDRSGWMTLVNFVPIVNLIFFIRLGFVRGSVGPNRFGADPLG